MSDTRHLWRGLLLAAALLALAGCANTRESASTGAPAISPLGAMSLRQAPVTGEAARFAFAPVSGPPVAVLQALSAALNRETAGKLTVVPTSDPAATYVVRGYFSTVSDRKVSTLVYVWDVVDAKGVRLHRVSGQVRLGAASPDPWTLVDARAIELTARKTVAGLASWSKQR